MRRFANIYYFNIRQTKYGIAKFYVTRIFHPSARRAANPFYHVYTKNHFPERDIPKIRVIAGMLLRLTRNKKLIFGGEKKNSSREV